MTLQYISWNDMVWSWNWWCHSPCWRKHLQ